DAARIVAERGRLMQAQAPGRMVVVRAPEDEVRPLLPKGVEVAAINTPRLVVISGHAAAMAAAVEVLNARGLQTSDLLTSHAFHSSMMTPAVSGLEQRVAAASRSAPSLEVFSTALARVMKPEEVMDPTIGDVRS